MPGRFPSSNFSSDSTTASYDEPSPNAEFRSTSRSFEGQHSSFADTSELVGTTGDDAAREQQHSDTASSLSSSSESLSWAPAVD